ncbi:MAG: AIR synthase-related protein [Thermoplasmata archaeon]
MGRGKAEIGELRGIIRKHRDGMLKSNVIGSDFSFLNERGENMIFKIEPMVYYHFLSPEENARLSLTFPMNDFLTSGTFPGIAMVDFERPRDSGKDYWRYVDSLLGLLEIKGIKVASGHTGNYGNLRSGVAGSMALIGFRKPLFSYARIRKGDAFFVVGRIGLETRYFYEKKMYGRSEVPIEELSVEKYVVSLLKESKTVHYIHDLSEGGLIRALQEVAFLNNEGFEINYSSVRHLIGDVNKGSKLSRLSSSSSGSILVSIGVEHRERFENIARRNSWPYAEVKRGGKNVRLDGKIVSAEDRFSNLVN